MPYDLTFYLSNDTEVSQIAPSLAVARALVCKAFSEGIDNEGATEDVTSVYPPSRIQSVEIRKVRG